MLLSLQRCRQLSALLEPPRVVLEPPRVALALDPRIPEKRCSWSWPWPRLLYGASRLPRSSAAMVRAFSVITLAIFAAALLLSAPAVRGDALKDAQDKIRQ